MSPTFKESDEQYLNKCHPFFLCSNMIGDSQILQNYEVTTKEENSYLTILVSKGNMSILNKSVVYIQCSITFMSKYTHSQLKENPLFSPYLKKNISLFLNIYKTITGEDHFYCKEIVHFTRKFIEELLKYQSLPVHSAVSYHMVNYFIG